MNDLTARATLLFAAPALSGRPVWPVGRPLHEISPRKQPSLLLLLQSKEIPFMYIAAAVGIAIL